MSTHRGSRSKYSVSTSSTQNDHYHTQHYSARRDSYEHLDRRSQQPQGSYFSHDQYHHDTHRKSTSNHRHHHHPRYSTSTSKMNQSTSSKSSAHGSPVASSPASTVHSPYYSPIMPPEDLSWLMATPIDDDDLTFGGKPLCTWYEEDRRRFSMGEESNRTVESDEEEERGRQRVRTHYQSSPSHSHRHHHGHQTHGGSSSSESKH